MKNIASLILVILVVGVLSLYLVAYQVRETEYVVVSTFGKTEAVKDAGLYFKWPAPIQKIYRFDSRLHTYNSNIEESQTADGYPIIIRTNTTWRVDDPVKFYATFKTADIREAEVKLLGVIRDSQNAVIGKYNFGNFINTDPEKIMFDKIQSEMKTDILAKAAENYGIGIADVGITELKISQDINKDVFARMKADRNSEATKIINVGNSMANKIRSWADERSKALLAAADARAKAIRGEGDAQAASYYKKLDEDPEFAMFLRDIEALREILKDNTTIVLGAESDPIRYLKSIPDIQPKKENAESDK